jgi:hypothetical protein
LGTGSERTWQEDQKLPDRSGQAGYRENTGREKKPPETQDSYRIDEEIGKWRPDMTLETTMNIMAIRRHPAGKGPWKKASWRERGFTLKEVLGVMTIALTVAGITFWNYRSLHGGHRMYTLAEERVNKLRDALVMAHLRAQQGERQEVPLQIPGLDMEGAPPAIAFVPPYGSVEGMQPIHFRAGCPGGWWAFDIGADGLVLCQPEPTSGTTASALTTAPAPVQSSSPVNPD